MINGLEEEEAGNGNPGGVPPLKPEQLRDDRHVLSGQAFNWLNRELPKVDLPDEVELELTRYALRPA